MRLAILLLFVSVGCAQKNLASVRGSFDSGSELSANMKTVVADLTYEASIKGKKYLPTWKVTIDSIDLKEKTAVWNSVWTSETEVNKEIESVLSKDRIHDALDCPLTIEGSIQNGLIFKLKPDSNEVTCKLSKLEFQLSQGSGEVTASQVVINNYPNAKLAVTDVTSSGSAPSEGNADRGDGDNGRHSNGTGGQGAGVGAGSGGSIGADVNGENNPIPGGVLGSVRRDQRNKPSASELEKNGESGANPRPGSRPRDSNREWDWAE